MASRKVEDLCTPLKNAWENALSTWKIRHPQLPEPFLTCTFRSNEEQAKLYAQGRTTPGAKVTNAKPGQSKHNVFPSNAFDIAFIIAGKLDWNPDLFKKFSDIVKPMGVKWGGDWRMKDLPHFEI